MQVSRDRREPFKPSDLGLERASQVSAIINAKNVERVFSRRYSLESRIAMTRCT